MLRVNNADGADTAEILGEVTKLAEGKGGWLVLTSRRGAAEVWAGMIDEQLLRLEPLGGEDAMAMLWSRGEAVVSDIERLNHENRAE